MHPGLNTISFDKIQALNIGHVISYSDKIIITDQVERLDLFKYPCRIDGVVCLVCLQGDIYCNVNLKEYHLTAGMLIVNFSSSIIQLGSKTTGPFKVLAAMVTYDCLHALRIDLERRITFYLGVQNNAVAHLPEADIEAYKNIFGLLKKYMTGADYPDRDELIDSLIHALGLMVISSMGVHGAPTADSTTKRNRGSERIFEQFMTVLAQQNAHERNVAFYAQALNLTPNYLSLVIRQYTGRSASEWINEYTVTEAKVLLRFTNVSINEAAQRLGFPSQSAFGKYFKQYTGSSPLQFRKSVHAKERLLELEREAEAQKTVVEQL